MVKPLYSFRGNVTKGKERGRLLGFPTANIPLHIQIPEGIYAAVVRCENTDYLSATFIGSAKTFGEVDYKAECYLLDIDQNFYGKLFTVTLYAFIRDNQHFDSEEKLIAQMQQDILQVRKLKDTFIK